VFWILALSESVLKTSG
jgi:hypothetical protein